MSLNSHRCRTALLSCVLGLVCLLAAMPGLAYDPDPNAPRSEVPEDARWNPNHIFSDNAAWEVALAAVEEAIPTMGEYEGRLGESAETLLAALKAREDVGLQLRRVASYASYLFDVDMSDNDHRAMQGRVRALFPQLGQALAYMEPELLTIDMAVLEGFMAGNEDLAVYDYYFRDMRRTEQYTLSQAEERIMALAGPLRGVPGEGHESLLGIDITFPDIIDEEGNSVPLSMAGFTGYRSCSTYNVRKQAAETFFGTLRSYENTFATLLDGEVRGHIMNKDARGYSSCLEASLTPDNISTASYNMLIDTLGENFERTLHKYITLRKKVMGLDGPVTFSNLYNPMLDSVDLEYSYEEGRELILDALKPLGDEYLGYLAEGLDPANGWIDIYPNENKRTGAYSSGGLAAELHPFILHNFDNTLDAVSTTAHEFGHSMHSVFSSNYQPPVYRGYSMFLAEVASTCNEDLMTRYLMKRAKDADTKLSLMNMRMEAMRLTIFRQTLFAEFELRFHEHAEAGNALTAEFLNSLYAELITKYYGPDFAMGPNDECEWMFIPHFYYNFYVFTYATGLTSGISLAEQISKHGEKAATKYIDGMLKGGSSAPPLELLSRAGVNLETSQPILDMLDLFEETIEEFDKVWTKAYGTD